ncbi:hypothetical protein SVIOM342S_06429 [Streptomyces violaceorubidus]
MDSTPSPSSSSPFDLVSSALGQYIPHGGAAAAGSAESQGLGAGAPARRRDPAARAHDRLPQGGHRDLAAARPRRRGRAGPRAGLRAAAAVAHQGQRPRQCAAPGQRAGHQRGPVRRRPDHGTADQGRSRTAVRGRRHRQRQTAAGPGRAPRRRGPGPARGAPAHQPVGSALDGPARWSGPRSCADAAGRNQGARDRRPWQHKIASAPRGARDDRHCHPLPLSRAARRGLAGREHADGRRPAAGHPARPAPARRSPDRRPP